MELNELLELLSKSEYGEADPLVSVVLFTDGSGKIVNVHDEIVLDFDELDDLIKELEG